jgi:hypothetical protein
MTIDWQTIAIRALDIAERYVAVHEARELRLGCGQSKSEARNEKPKLHPMAGKKAW